MNRAYPGFLLAACLLLPACGPAARFAMRDPRRSSEIKTIAILPFFNANMLSVEFLSKGPSKAPLTTDFTKQAKKHLSKRYEFITGDRVEEALKKTGKYQTWKKEEGRHQRTGFTISEALKTGKELGADAVIIGAGAVRDDKGLKKLFQSTLTIRLLDVKNGKVLWGATALRKGSMDADPSKKIVRRLAKEALP